MNIKVHISFWIIVLSGYMPGVGLLDHMVILFLVFWGTSVTESKLTLLATWEASESKGQSVEARNMTLFRKPADQEDGRLMSQNNHLVRVWMPDSFIEPEREMMRKLSKKGRIERERWWWSKVKRAISLAKHLLEWPAFREGCVSFLFLATIHRWAGSGYLPVSWTKAH